MRDSRTLSMSSAEGAVDVLNIIWHCCAALLGPSWARLRLFPGKQACCSCDESIPLTLCCAALCCAGVVLRRSATLPWSPCSSPAHPLCWRRPRTHGTQRRPLCPWVSAFFSRGELSSKLRAAQQKMRSKKPTCPDLSSEPCSQPPPTHPPAYPPTNPACSLGYPRRWRPAATTAAGAGHGARRCAPVSPAAAPGHCCGRGWPSTTQAGGAPGWQNPCGLRFKGVMRQLWGRPHCSTGTPLEATQMQHS